MNEVFKKCLLMIGFVTLAMVLLFLLKMYLYNGISDQFCWSVCLFTGFRRIPVETPGIAVNGFDLDVHMEKVQSC